MDKPTVFHKKSNAQQLTNLFKRFYGFSDTLLSAGMLTEMTQSATGFFSALSAVSFSLVSSMPVTCSMLNTLSSSMYIT